MNVRAETAPRDAHPDVSEPEAKARQPSPARIRERKAAVRVRRRSRDERVGVGVAADDAMENDDVVRLDEIRLLDKVADPPLDAVAELVLRREPQGLVWENAVFERVPTRGLM